MNKHTLKRQISTPTIIKNSLIDYVWSILFGMDTKYMDTNGQMHATVILIPVVQKHAMGYVFVV
jgi:hypothetical protein